MSKKASLDHKQLRAIGHKLKPVVTVAGNGLSDTVLQEVLRALGDHELIKVKVAAEDHDARDTMIAALAEGTGSALVQRIGHTAVLYRPSTDHRQIVLPRP